MWSSLLICAVCLITSYRLWLYCWYANRNHCASWKVNCLLLLAILVEMAPVFWLRDQKMAAYYDIYGLATSFTQLVLLIHLRVLSRKQSRLGLNSGMASSKQP